MAKRSDANMIDAPFLRTSGVMGRMPGGANVSSLWLSAVLVGATVMVGFIFVTAAIEKVKGVCHGRQQEMEDREQQRKYDATESPQE
jgi:hypothetical protein